MLRFTLVLTLLAITVSGCFLSNGYQCGYFYYPEKAGSYNTYEIPDQYVAMGDTLYLNINEYWDYEYSCNEHADYPNINSLIADSREVELHRQENDLFIVGKKTGIFSASVIGMVELIRNSRNSTHSVPMSFRVEVGTSSQNSLRQRAAFPPTGRIDSIVVANIFKDKKTLRLNVHFSPEDTSAKFSNLDAHWAFYPSQNIDSLKQMGISVQATQTFGRDFYLNPDSLYPFYYGYVEIEPGRRKFGKTFIFETASYFEQ